MAQNVELNNYKFKDDDFELVQNDAKIFDQKFETKPTTFFKDALRRFRKNKSSVAGAIILGIIAAFAFIVPVANKNDIDTIQRDQNYLAPKLFEAGRGFWDGTEKIKNKPYDEVEQKPAGDFVASAVSELVVDDFVSYTNNIKSYGKNGYINFVNDLGDEKIATLTSPAANYKNTGNYTIYVEFLDDELTDIGHLGKFKVSLVGKEATIVLRDWSSNYSSETFNISNKLNELSLNVLTDASLVFELESRVNISDSPYILIKECSFTCDDNDKNAERLTSLISFKDASAMARIEAKDDAFWKCAGSKKIYKSEYYNCSFRYDTYEAAFGLADAIEVSWSKLLAAKKEGKVNFDECIKWNEETQEYDGIDQFLASYEKIDPTYPYDEIVAVVNFNNKLHKPLSVSASAYKYIEKGYTKMPKYIFGTDTNGQDLFKKCFYGLRSSFGLAAIIASFCFIFGLVWGAISGYFGGYTDLFMERFCDILGRVPDLLVISLLTVHWGSGYKTFIVALIMTGWMGTAGLTRTQFYRFKGREYVLASRTLGASDGRLIFKHILPNSMGTIVTSSVFMITSVIRSEASFAYLHIGLDSSNSFGVMLSENQTYIGSHPYLIVVPSVIMGLMMISFNLFGNGLRDALNPSLKGSE